MTTFSHSSPNREAAVSGIILAGGKSRRMGGINKALLRIGGRRLVERTCAVLTSLFTEVIVVTNSFEDFQFLGLPMVSDLVPGKGSLGGLYTGLKACKHDWAFLVACDMPFLNRDAILHIVSQIRNHDVVIPKIGHNFEPLHAAYSQKCLAHVEKLLAEGDLKIIDLLPNVNVLEVPEQDLRQFDPQLRFILNLNTPDDFKGAEELAAEIDRTKKS
jgi:molybdopterin-guanine dinucleotide biosynthesis protein A